MTDAGNVDSGASTRPVSGRPGQGDPPGELRPPVAEERPVGVSLLIWLFWFWAGAILLLFLGLAVGDGPVMLGGRAVSRAEALTAVLPALVPMALAVVGAALALALARPWGRAAALFPFALAAFGPVLTGIDSVTPLELSLAALIAVPVLALLVWYLYYQPGPRAYFRRDRDRRPGTSPE